MVLLILQQGRKDLTLYGIIIYHILAVSCENQLVVMAMHVHA